MTHFVRASLLAAVVWSAASPVRANPHELLAHLGRELTRIHATTSSDPVGILQPVPKVDPLVGMDRAAIEQSLGRPESPSEGCLPESCPPGVAVWMFFKLPPGWRGGGAELHLTFDSTGRCISAAWRYSR